MWTTAPRLHDDEPCRPVGSVRAVVEAVAAHQRHPAVPAEAQSSQGHRLVEKLHVVRLRRSVVRQGWRTSRARRLSRHSQITAARTATAINVSCMTRRELGAVGHPMEPPVSHPRGAPVDVHRPAAGPDVREVHGARIDAHPYPSRPVGPACMEMRTRRSRADRRERSVIATSGAVRRRSRGARAGGDSDPASPCRRSRSQSALVLGSGRSKRVGQTHHRRARLERKTPDPTG